MRNTAETLAETFSRYKRVTEEDGIFTNEEIYYFNKYIQLCRAITNVRKANSNFFNDIIIILENQRGSLNVSLAA